MIVEPLPVVGTAERWEAACRTGDPDTIAALLSDDAVVWYNHERVEHGRDAYRAILADSARNFRNPRYRDFRLSLHPGGFVEQATLVGDTDDGAVATPFCLFATVTNGLITRLDEYFDTAMTTPA